MMIQNVQSDYVDVSISSLNSMSQSSRKIIFIKKSNFTQNSILKTGESAGFDRINQRFEYPNEG